MKKIAFITSTDAEYGFRLAGITHYAIPGQELEDTLKKVMADPANGLVIIDERLLVVLTEERLREIERGWSGILLVMSSPVKPPPETEDYAARLIRRAIGYHVRLSV